MSRILVIGYGNPLRQDDGVGWRVVESLEESSCAIDGVRVQQLAPEVAESVSSAWGVVFVDALARGVPGAVHVTPLGEGTGAVEDSRRASEEASRNRWTHWIGPEEILELARRLYGRAPRAALVTVGAGQLGHGEGLSRAVQEAIPEACHRIVALIRSWLEEASADGRSPPELHKPSPQPPGDSCTNSR